MDIINENVNKSPPPGVRSLFNRRSRSSAQTTRSIIGESRPVDSLPLTFLLVPTHTVAFFLIFFHI